MRVNGKNEFLCSYVVYQGRSISGTRCYRPAAQAVKSQYGSRDWEPICKLHAGTERRKVWGQRELGPITPSVSEQWAARHAADQVASAAKREAERVRAAEAAVVYAERRAAEAAVVYRAVRVDERAVDLPSLTERRDPRWYVVAADQDLTEREPRYYNAASIEIQREQALPPIIRIVNSSHLDVNAAKALAEALTMALAEVEK